MKAVAIFSIAIFLTSFNLRNKDNFSDNLYSQYTYETFATLPPANQEIDLNNIDYELLNASVFYASNKQRALHKKKPFAFYPLLRDAAVTQSTQMVKFDFFDHQNPANTKLKTLKDRLESVGGVGKYTAAGENISEYFLMDYQAREPFRIERVNNKQIYLHSKTGRPIKPHTYRSFGEAIVADWMTSPGHRANILEDKFTHLGCGSLMSTKPNQFPKVKATQVFGRLKEAK